MSVSPYRKITPWLLAGALLLGIGYLAGRFGSRFEAIWDHDEQRVEGHPAPDKESQAGRGSGASEHTSTQDEQDQGKSNIVKFDTEALRLAGLQIESVRYRAVPTHFSVTGVVEPNPSGMVNVTPRVAGKVQSVLVNVGSHVSAGQPLATLTSTDLANAQAAYRRAVAQVAVAANDLKRQQKLAQLGAFGSPPLETARSQAATLQAEVRTAQSDVNAAQAAVAQAQSQVRVQRAALSQAETKAHLAQTVLRRDETLLQAQIIARQEYDQAAADYQNELAGVDSARATITQAQAALQTARADLQAAQAKRTAAQRRYQIAQESLAREQAVYKGGYTTSKEIVAAEATLQQARLDRQAAADQVRLFGGIPGDGDVLILKAPLPGDVTERTVTLGETVTPDKSLLTILNLHTVWVQLDVYTGDVPRVYVGQAVTVTSDSVPGRSFFGTISYISDVVDPATRTVKVRCVLRNEGDRLKPGAFVRGSLSQSPRTLALAVPEEAIQSLGGKSIVFMPTETPGEFQAHPVEVGEKRGDLVTIRSGLKPGDRIVTKNAFLVKAQATKGEFGESSVEGKDND